MNDDVIDITDKLQRFCFVSWIIISVICIVIALSLYKHYVNQLIIEKEQILQASHQKISEIIVDKLQSLAFQVSSNIQNDNLIIKKRLMQ